MRDAGLLRPQSLLERGGVPQHQRGVPVRLSSDAHRGQVRNPSPMSVGFDLIFTVSAAVCCDLRRLQFTF